MAKLQNKLPTTKYLKFLTDNFGVWQHASKEGILKSEGYALDDSSRALIVFLLYGDKNEAETCLNYIEKSVNGKGDFYYFFNSKKEPVSFGRLGYDAYGLALWALGFAHDFGFEKERVDKVISKIDLSIGDQKDHTRPNAYLLNAFCLLKDEKKAKAFAEKLVSCFDEKTNWFEDKLTYANAVLPYSLLNYLVTFNIKNTEIENIVKSSIRTLEKYMRIGVIPMPAGNTHWQKLGSNLRDICGQQPIEAGFMILFLVEAYKYFGDKKYKVSVEEWYEWFFGNNIYKKSLINENDGCADGIDENGISENRGAESTIMFLWAAKAIQELD